MSKEGEKGGRKQMSRHSVGKGKETYKNIKIKKHRHAWDGKGSREQIRNNKGPAKMTQMKTQTEGEPMQKRIG